MAGAAPRRLPCGSDGGGGGVPRASAAWHLDRLLVTLCLLASVTLLYRCIVFTGGLLPLGGSATVITTATAGDGSAAGVITELTVDRFGRARSTTFTQGDTGMSITVMGGGSGGRRGRRAGLRTAGGAAAAAKAAVAAHGDAAGNSQTDEPQAFPGLPADFDPQAYLMYHPDLRALGITTADHAKAHYLQEGRAQGRPYKRLRVLLRYTACTGLINQQYSHIAAFALAAALGAELVLPPAVCRDSFAHYFSVYKEKNEVRWSPVPLETLLDVDAIMAYWAPRGLVLHRTPSLRPFPDLTQPEVAYPQYPAGSIDPNLVVRMEGVYLKNLELSELMERARAAVVGQATAILRDDPAADLQYIVLDMPCSFFSLRALSNLPVVTEVAKSLKFAPELVSMADRIVEAMTAGGKHEFNGVHLRIEKDARDWAAIMGGQQVVWQGYISTMRGVGFNRSTRIYVASGMLTYGASVEMDRTKNYLTHTGVCSRVHHKEQYIPQEELETLNSEQKALLDFLVLARSQRFVGFGSSTFSFYLREYRTLHGMLRATSGLVDASIIGTDPLFHAAGTVV
ncbi:alternative oxidase [Micractinium conductrix]|uniref:O-fucosyltransferase family protein n=1 Tax=Micractinium conductrix TaxID=554055 RepID=A0A2P6V8Y6_9CHLO|nr:alternative oxidase [Micractinium conductrix]|eukprot:PSC70539.1 alternative oxidase [Micractinium conductrix]